MSHYEKIKKCRISGSSNLVDILDLGSQPLANSLKKNADDHEEKIPLSISLCPDSSLVQLNETVDKEILFNNYLWVTGTSSSVRKYADVFFKRVSDIVDLKSRDLIIEIASNDGTFLKPFIRSGFRNVIGVDPAKNVAQKANRNGVKTLCEFWGHGISEEIAHRYGRSKIVIARNVIPHVSELEDVMAGIENILQDKGVGMIEFHSAGKILEDLQYDSIYHEHLCYFSIQSISYLLNRFNLIPFHIDESPISGGSSVIYFSKNFRSRTQELIQHTENEQKKRINELESWMIFAQRAEEHKRKTLQIISSIENKRIIGFGSSARSQTYLNYCGIDKSVIQGIIDNNQMKQGLFTPGSTIPILSFHKGMQMSPDLVFILAWNFRDEIVQECRDNGYRGAFCVPFPNEPYFFAS